MAFAFLLDPDIAKNEGAFRPLKVMLKEGTIVWAREGAPVTMCTSHCSNEIIEAIIVALAPACPERAMGGWGRRLRIALNGRGSAHRAALHLAHVPGAARRRRLGGRRRVLHHRRVALRRRHQVRLDRGGGRPAFRWCSKRTNTGQAPPATGKYRGGYGGDMRLRVETDGPALANTAGEGVVHGARGMLGGQDGAPHDYTLLRARRAAAQAEKQGGRRAWCRPAA